jgi:hypothetical protein
MVSRFIGHSSMVSTLRRVQPRRRRFRGSSKMGYDQQKRKYLAATLMSLAARLHGSPGRTLIWLNVRRGVTWPPLPINSV